MKTAVGVIRSGRKSTKERSLIEGWCLKNDMAVTEWKEVEPGAFGQIAFGDWMKGRKVDAVVVADADLVSGNVNEYYAYKCVLRRRHSDLVAVKDGFGGYDLYKNIYEGFIDTLCKVELENEPIRKPHDRMDKVARGAYIGGIAPMGYKVENGKLVVNPAEVPAVLFIMERKHRGASILGTVQELNAKGYKTRRGKEFVISTVYGIWNNEQFYRGFYRYSKDGDWVPGQHEAILKD